MSAESETDNGRDSYTLDEIDKAIESMFRSAPKYLVDWNKKIFRIHLILERHASSESSSN